MQTFAVSSGLCTLWEISDTGKTVRPVARSYLGNEWEAYAGKFADLTFACNGTTCDTILPSPGSGFSYELRAFDHSLPLDDEIARFLEQASFGPTLAEIETFKSSFGASPAAWIKHQQDVAPPSSHRGFFRSRLNERYELPSYMGAPRRPCEAGTRYRRFALSSRDYSESSLVIEEDSIGRKKFIVSGQVRTVVDAVMSWDEEVTTATLLNTGEYKFCWPVIENYVGSRFRIRVPGVGCKDIFFDGVASGNPPIVFDSITPPELPVLELTNHAAIVQETYYPGTLPHDLLLESPVDQAECDLFPQYEDGPLVTVLGDFEGNYYMHDPRFRVFENTLDRPKMNAGSDLVAATKNNGRRFSKVQCFNAPMTFLNEDHCMLSYDEDACTSKDPADALIELTYRNMQNIYDATNLIGDPKYVYAVDKLTQNGVPYQPPCAPGAPSRWVLESDCASEVAIDALTSSAFQELIGSSTDTNPLLRDVTFPTIGISCHSNDVSKFDFTVVVNGQCWKNVHLEHLQVFEFSGWVANHNGGPEKIMQWATRTDSLFRLQYPASHEMDRWYRAEPMANRLDIGRLGDVIRFRDLPDPLQTDAVAEAFDATEILDSLGAKVVCGSPFEIADKPENAGEIEKGAFAARTVNNSTTVPEIDEQRVMIWMDIAMNGGDNLRQRVAWALSQILAISPDGFTLQTYTEAWAVRLMVCYERNHTHVPFLKLLSSSHRHTMISS